MRRTVRCCTATSKDRSTKTTIGQSVKNESKPRKRTKEDDHHEFVTFYVSHFLKLYHDIPDSICLEVMSYLKESSVPLDEYYGHWIWKHNGRNQRHNETVILSKNGFAKGTGNTTHVRNWTFQRGFILIYFGREPYAHWMKLEDSVEPKQLTLYYPIRNPKTIATFARPLDERDAMLAENMQTQDYLEMVEGDLLGQWQWCHDGTTVNGNIVLQKEGAVSSTMGWSGQRWYICGDVLFVRFNRVDHAMVWEDEKRNRLILLEPRRNPQSTAYRSTANK